MVNYQKHKENILDARSKLQAWQAKNPGSEKVPKDISTQYLKAVYRWNLVNDLVNHVAPPPAAPPPMQPAPDGGVRLGNPNPILKHASPKEGPWDPKPPAMQQPDR